MDELYDPYDHVVHNDPYPIYRELRDNHPVYRNETRGFWALSRFEDVWNAVHEPIVFSSVAGITIARSTTGARMETAGQSFMPMMIMMDPPRHDQLRKLVSRAFTPQRIRNLEESVRKVTSELVDSFIDRGSCDLTQELAVPLPSIVIADLLGVPREDREEFRHWSDQMVKLDPDDPVLMAEGFEGSMALNQYFRRIIAARRAEPREDLVTHLIDAEIDGERLSEEELVGFCCLLLVAGNETTTNLISNAALLLARYPDQRDALVGDLSLLDRAVEEFLRYDSPVQGLARTLTRDVEVHDTTMRTGDKVLLLFAAANRDEREFFDPDRLNVARAADRHLAFGHGVHYCLGAWLARLEFKAAYKELLLRMPEWDLADGMERLHSGPIRGLVHLPITFRQVERVA